KLNARAYPASAFPVQPDQRFGGYLVDIAHIGQPRIDRARCALSHRRIKSKFNKRNELIERLLFRCRKPKIGVHVQGAVLDGKSPMQGFAVLDLDRYKRLLSRSQPVGAIISVERRFRADSSGNCERPQPREIAAKVAEPFAEKESWLEMIALARINRPAAG